MNTNYEQQNNSTPAPRSLGTGTIAGVAALIAATGGLWYQSNQTDAVRQQLTQSQQRIEQLQGQMQTSISASKTEMNESLALMKEQVAQTRVDALAGAKRAQTVAQKKADEVLTQVKSNTGQLAAKIDEVMKSNEDSRTEVAQSLTGIKDDVGVVKTEVETAKGEIAKTSAELKRMTGDMGVMSGLIATNATELTALRKLGERDYLEFTLPKGKGVQRVGDIMMALKKTDTKRNKFTMEVVADDRRVEKKDKTANEPVQFYTANSRVPYEVVVNEVRKDMIVGYLAIPKVKQPLRGN